MLYIISHQVANQIRNFAFMRQLEPKSLIITSVGEHMEKAELLYSSPLYSWGIGSNTPSGCLKPQVVPNLIYVFCYVYILMIKFNL